MPLKFIVSSGCVRVVVCSLFSRWRRIWTRIATARGRGEARQVMIPARAMDPLILTGQVAVHQAKERPLAVLGELDLDRR
jgi:hypothetical protein